MFVDHNNFFGQCLICLDDYQPEEDIRVMSCRHAFHQTCVDEWLQTGRNNCPACRTTVRSKISVLQYIFVSLYLSFSSRA
jgi:Ring finger domain